MLPNTRSAHASHSCRLCNRSSAFGFRTSFGLRASDFGFCLVAALAGCAVGPNYQRPAGPRHERHAGRLYRRQPDQRRALEAGPTLRAPAARRLVGAVRRSRVEPPRRPRDHATTSSSPPPTRTSSRPAPWSTSPAPISFPRSPPTPSYARQRTSANQSSAPRPPAGAPPSTPSASRSTRVGNSTSGAACAARSKALAPASTASADDLESAKLAIQAEVAIDYFTLRSLDAQDARARGNDRRLPAARSNSPRTAARAALPPISTCPRPRPSSRPPRPRFPLWNCSAPTSLHALAILCGQPADLASRVNAPHEYRPGRSRHPVSVPSELLEHRPDIAAAERRMAAANADVGVAYCRVLSRASCSTAWPGSSPSTPARSSTGRAASGPLALRCPLPLFTGGRNRAQLASARAAYDATVANYRQTVLSAFQDVEDQLAAQRLLAQEYEKESAALKSARRTRGDLHDEVQRRRDHLPRSRHRPELRAGPRANGRAIGRATPRRRGLLIKALGAGMGCLPGQLRSRKPKPPASLHEQSRPPRHRLAPAGPAPGG